VLAAVREAWIRNPRMKLGMLLTAIPVPGGDLTYLADAELVRLLGETYA